MTGTANAITSLFVASAVMLAACAAPEPGLVEEPQLTPVRIAVATPAFATSSATQTSVPMALGYFEDEGLEVELIAAGGSPGAIQHVVANQAEIALAAPSAVAPAIAAGADLKVYYNHITSNIFLPAVPDGRPIEDVGDLVGTRIGVSSLESGTVQLTRGLLAEEGHDPDSVEFLPVGVGPEAFEYAKRGDIDALSLWDVAYVEIEDAGLPLTMIGPEWYRELTLFQGLIASSELLETRPEIAIGVARAIAKGHAFGQANPEESVRIHWSMYPEDRPTGIPEEEAFQQGLRKLLIRNETTDKRNGMWGYASADEAERILEFYVDSGIISAPLDAGLLWTEEYLVDINDFDESAVRAAARRHPRQD